MHPASLVHPASHSHVMLQLIGMVISPPLIGELLHPRIFPMCSLFEEYTVDCVTEAVRFALDHDTRASAPSSSFHRKRTSRYTGSRSAEDDHRHLTDFVTTLVSHAQITTPTLLVALTYITRARAIMSIRGASAFVAQRLILGALVLASKYTQDSTMLNCHWAMCTAGLFTTRDVSKIERDVLAVLDWELRVREVEVLVQCEGMKKRADEGLAESVRYSGRNRSVRHHRRRRITTTSVACTSSAGVPDLASSPASSRDIVSPRTPQDVIPSWREPSKATRVAMSVVRHVKRRISGIIVPGS
ncbi:unnamed protein product [Mycena citricolor]|uniref:Cyclin N-terminal domain-containing protein n=1 Tax=Mycena citricolor TaxID=2018698 RepID=A0AAD2HPM6_9AGAR|nr:unnamed protein product [Mycena citricolor]